MVKNVEFENSNDDEEQEVPQIKKKIKKEYELVQVPTQHTLAVQTSNGDIISTEQLLVILANEIEGLKRAIVG